MQASQNINLSHCFRQVTRMAEANVEPPESALDESGSGEDQKEEKQDEEEEGDRAFEVDLFIKLHATHHWRSCCLSACYYLPISSSQSSSSCQMSS